MAPTPPRLVLLGGLLLAAVVAGCSPGQDAREDGPSEDAADPSPAALPALLAGGEAVFGIFPGPSTREQGRLMGENPALDFVFYSLESGPFDLETMGTYMEGIAEGAAPGPTHPVALRIPPIRDGVETARANAAAALEAGVAGIVFPHVESGEDAAVAVSAMGGELWPGSPGGSLVNMLIVEDRIGIENVGDIVGTPGVSVVFAGPGDLRRAYEGDMEAVEGAIQTVLAACLEHEVPCGITAGVDDIASRLEQGFQVFIVTAPEAVGVGREAAGR